MTWEPRRRKVALIRFTATGSISTTIAGGEPFWLWGSFKKRSESSS
jgi:hypothetical protein